MLRRSSTFHLRHISTVIPKATNAVSRVTAMANTEFFRAQENKAFYTTSHEEIVESETVQKHLVSLRIGGAKVLATANRPVMAQPERSPLHFAAARPRDAGLCQTLCASLDKLKIRKLTDLQGALIPMLLRGRHVIGHAETGSGKSFGIALATCNRMLREQTTNRLHTLILVPTDALALQYERWFRHFAGSSRQVVLAAVSQYPLEHQLSQLHNVQPHVLVGTPQRLADIASLCPVIIGEKLRKKVDCIVLDEVDVLLKTPITPPSSDDKKIGGKFEKTLADEGLGKFSSTIGTCSELIDRLYRNEAMELPAQIVAVSATVDGDSAARLNTWMRNDMVTRLTTSIEEQAVPDTLSFYFACENELQGFPIHRLLHLFLQHIACQVPKARIMIFVDESQFEIEDLTRYVSELPKFPKLVADTLFGEKRLHQNGDAGINRWDVVSLKEDFEEKNNDDENSQQQKQQRRQGEDKESGNRRKSPIQSPMANHTTRKIIGRNGEIFCFNDTNLSKLESYQAQIGIAPFSLARGLHVANVSHVIIFGDSPGANEFLHCGGRTGRRGRKGEVISLFTPSGGRQMKSICETLTIPWHAVRPADVEKNLGRSIQEAMNRIEKHNNNNNNTKNHDDDMGNQKEEQQHEKRV